MWQRATTGASGGVTVTDVSSSWSGSTHTQANNCDYLIISINSGGSISAVGKTPISTRVSGTIATYIWEDIKAGQVFNYYNINAFNAVEATS